MATPPTNQKDDDNEDDVRDTSDDYDNHFDPIYDFPRDNPKLAAPEYMAFTIYAFQQQQRIIRKLKEEYKNNREFAAMFLRGDLNELERFSQNAQYGFELGNLQTERWQNAYHLTKKQLDSRTIQVLFMWNIITRRFTPIQLAFDFVNDDETSTTDNPNEAESC